MPSDPPRAQSDGPRLVPSNDERGSWDLEADGCIVQLDRRPGGKWNFWQVDVCVGVGEVVELGARAPVSDQAARWLEDAWRAAGGPERDGV